MVLCAGEGVVVPDVNNESALDLLGRIGLAGLLGAAEFKVVSYGRFFHLLQQIDDGFVAVGRHPHALARLEQSQNDSGAGKGFASPRWSLDEEVTLIESLKRRDDLWQRCSFGDQGGACFMVLQLWKRAR